MGKLRIINIFLDIMYLCIISVGTVPYSLYVCLSIQDRILLSWPNLLLNGYGERERDASSKVQYIDDSQDRRLLSTGDEVLD